MGGSGARRSLLRFSDYPPASRPNKDWRARYLSTHIVRDLAFDQEDAFSIFSQTAPVWPKSVRQVPAREVNPPILIIDASGGRWPKTIE